MRHKQLPGNLDQSIFRIGAFAFCSLGILALITDYVPPGLLVNYPAAWGITAVACIGGAISWMFARRRAPVQFVLLLSLLGVFLITIESIETGGTHSHVVVLYVVPVIFTAALLEFRATALVIAAAILAAGLPLFAGWDGPYGRTLIILAGVMALTAYVETRLLGAAVRERAEAEHRALYDDLTGLPNRALFFSRVRELTAAEPASRVAVLLMDIDHFKDINDTLGHKHGDRVLKEISTRLKHAVRQADTVARLGGDEFGILAPGLPAGASQELAREVLTAFDAPVVVDGIEIDIQASVGVALYPSHGMDVDSLVQRADVAMYQAKVSPGNDYKLYLPERDPNSTQRLELTAELRRALKEGELVLHYQPQIDMQTRRVTAVEGLVRWRHPHYGLLQPDKFLTIAQQAGLMRPLTREVLKMAVKQARAWREAGTDLDVAVNVAAVDLLDIGFPDELEAVLAEHKIEARHVELEITEGTIMADPVRAAIVLRRLHRIGVRLWVDDFGTGYSSLSYLKDLPVDGIKVDRSFVHDMITNPDDEVIVRAIIDLARNLGLMVVAEGVEDQPTWDRLSSLMCDRAQGYHLSPPLSEKEFSVWLRHWSQLAEIAVETPVRQRLSVVA